VYPPLFCKLRSSSNPTNKNQTALSRWPFRMRHMFIRPFCSQLSILSPPKILTFPSESPCIYLVARLTSDNILPLLVKSVRSYCCLPLVIRSYFIFDSRKSSATLLPFYWRSACFIAPVIPSAVVSARDSPESWQMQTLRRY
jgi:hypothetical protein